MLQNALQTVPLPTTVSLRSGSAALPAAPDAARGIPTAAVQQRVEQHKQAPEAALNASVCRGADAAASNARARFLLLATLVELNSHVSEDLNCRPVSQPQIAMQEEADCLEQSHQLLHLLAEGGPRL